MLCRRGVGRRVGSARGVTSSSPPEPDSSPIENGGCQPLDCVSDVTELTQQQEQLGYLAGLLENTEDAVVAMDARYLLTTWNKGAERLYGGRAEEVVGRHVNDVAQTNLSEAERDELCRELAEHGRWRGELAVARKDGTIVDVELISVALRAE